MSERFDELEKVIVEGEEIGKMLLEGLAGVLAPNPPQAVSNGSGTTSHSPCSPASERLALLTARVQGTNTMLRAMSARLEV